MKKPVAGIPTLTVPWAADTIRVIVSHHLIQNVYEAYRNELFTDVPLDPQHMKHYDSLIRKVLAEDMCEVVFRNSQSETPGFTCKEIDLMQIFEEISIHVDMLSVKSVTVLYDDTILFEC